MIIFQILSVLFALFMVYVVSIHGKKKNLSAIEVSFWLSTWVIFAIFAVFPSLLEGVTVTLRFTRVFDLLVVIGLMILSVIVFFNYFSQKELQRKLEEFVREKAVAEMKKRNHARK